MSALFVSIEGIDASGKTTVTNKVSKVLEQQGIKVLKVDKKFVDYQDPKLKIFTSGLRSLIWGYGSDMLKPISSKGWLYLHALWFHVLAENWIRPNIGKYQVVLIDGWTYKMHSRFRLKNDLDMALLDNIFNSIYQCHKVFLLKPSPEVCWERRAQFRETELGAFDFEVTNPRDAFIRYQGMVAEQYCKVLDHSNCDVIEDLKKNADEMSVLISEKIIYEISCM